MPTYISLMKFLAAIGRQSLLTPESGHPGGYPGFSAFHAESQHSPL